ncbi:MAG: DUF1464 family protein [Candidatus Nezhaarchaeales archaeon]
MSGRFTCIKRFVEDVSNNLHDVLFMPKQKPKIEKLTGIGVVAKEAAEGAAIIASGLSHGRY